MKKTLTIDGNRIHDISSFYAEINRVFMANEKWKLGNSLDALNDMLYGAYGAAGGNDPIELIWLNIEKSRKDLGFDVTKKWYENKIKHSRTYNADVARKNLKDLESGTGRTYFEIIIDIIRTHERTNVRLESER